MFSFKEWQRGKIQRFYITPSTDNAFLSLTRAGKINVHCDDANFVEAVLAHLDVSGVSRREAYTAETLRQALSGLSVAASSPKKSIARFASSNHTSPSQAAKNALLHSPSDIKMNAGTLKRVVGTVDSREPAEVIAHYKTSKIPCSVAALPVGDIQFINEDDKTLVLIERKTSTDFYQSITSTRAHSQAERLFSRAQSLRENGWRVMVCWFIVETGGKTLYDILPDTKQMDGMLNYLTAILGQHVFSVLNDHHGAYLATKLVQGFNELKLTYPVKNETGQRVDIPKSARELVLPGASDNVEQDGHNVRLAQTNQLLYVLTSFSSVNMRVAKSLAGTGKSLQEILAMTEADLVSLHGVGKTLAKKIVQDFSI